MIIAAYIGLILTTVLGIFGILSTAHDDGVGQAVFCLFFWFAIVWSVWVVAQSCVH